MNLTFYKEENGNWYVSLPEWDGEIEDLQMVGGADTMCDILAQGEETLNVRVLYDNPNTLSGQPKVVLNKKIGIDYINGSISGCFYTPTFGITMSLDTVWLCDVTKFVFGYFPDEILIY